MTARSCATCRTDGSWHFDEEGNATRCPNYLAAEQEAAAAKLAKDHRNQINDAAKTAAREIVKDAAQRHYEFSSNELANEIESAQLPGSAIGPAFTWAASEAAGPLIEATNRFVMSSKASTRHRVQIWRSRVWRGGVHREEA